MGSAIAARAPADGYTILGGTISSHAINVSLYAKLDYDPVKSFTPVAMLGSGPLVLVVPASSPYKTLADVLAGSMPKFFRRACTSGVAKIFMMAELGEYQKAEVVKWGKVIKAAGIKVE